MPLKKKARNDGSYYWRFEVFKRRNPVTNKQEYYPSKNFERQKGWTDKRYDKEAKKAYIIYENDCKNGLVLSREQLKEREIKDEIARQKEKTLKEFIYEDFLPHKKREVELTSYTRYEGIVKHLDTIWNDKLSRINKRTLEKLIYELSDKYKRNTVGGILKIIKMVFKHAVNLELIEYSPAENLSLPKLTKAERAALEGDTKYKRLTPTQYDLLMKRLETETQFYKTLIYFMADSGVRVGEAMALKWKNVNLETGAVVICDNAQYIRRSGNLIKSPKNGYTRIIYLTDESLPEMKKWKAEQCPCSEWCFPSNVKPNQNIGYSAIRNRFVAIGNEIGVENFHPHMLRHTCASRWMEKGMPIQVVASRLGHQSISITADIYSHSSDETDKKAAEEWNRLRNISG